MCSSYTTLYVLTMERKGMTFENDFCYFILSFSSLLRKEEREKENEVAKIVIKSHTFLFHRFDDHLKFWFWIEQKGMTFDHDFC